MWYDEKGIDSDVVISTRVRLARNFNKYPFPTRATQEQKSEIVRMVNDAFNNDISFSFIPVSNLNEVERIAYTEKHLISREMTAGDANGREIILSNDGKVSIMVNEEDHLRIQCIMSGFALDDAYQRANEADDKIDSSIKNYAFNENLGFITHCPTNLGCAMRASVMLHLPGLKATRELASLSTALSNLGFTIRGLYGEGTESQGDIYQISNQLSLGFTEEEIITGLKDVIGKIVESERKARAELYKRYGIQLEDKIFRALGSLKYAKIISSKELFSIFSDIRIGISIGIINDISYEKLYKMIVELMPANLILSRPEAKNVEMRDIIRAEQLNNMLR